jgi:hypothetical protein
MYSYMAKVVPFKYLFALLHAEFESESEGAAATNLAKTVATRFGELLRE